MVTEENTIAPNLETLLAAAIISNGGLLTIKEEAFEDPSLIGAAIQIWWDTEENEISLSLLKAGEEL